jgi:hypothetical protein
MKQVLPKNLIPGKEYYIQSMIKNDDGNLIPCLSCQKLVATFDKLDFYHNSSDFDLLFSYFSNFRFIKDYESEGRPVNLNKYWKFYEVEKYEIQQNMEIRAINSLLRNITGDHYFHYILMKN